MRLNRYAMGALAATATLAVGGGAALAAATGSGDRATRCEQLVAKIAERRGVTVEELEANIKARLTARVDAAEQAGRISPERAAELRKGIASGRLCSGLASVPARLVARG